MNFRKKKSQYIFSKVDPKEILIDPRYVKPTKWDLQAIEEDLFEYVQLSRLIKAMPVLRVVDQTLVLISGAPFVRAARDVVPPLTKVACKIESDEESVRSVGLEIVNVSQLLDEVPENEVYDAVEMLAFTRPLTDVERLAVEEQILAFFREFSGNSVNSGDRYFSISPFGWDQAHRKIHWTWRRTDQFAHRCMMFMELLRNLDRTIAPLSSWNAMSVDTLLQKGPRDQPIGIKARRIDGSNKLFR
jgi:hypothetical protein